MSSPRSLAEGRWGSYGNNEAGPDRAAAQTFFAAENSEQDRRLPRSVRRRRGSGRLVACVAAVAGLDAEPRDHALQEPPADAGALGGAGDVAPDELQHRAHAHQLEALEPGAPGF